MTACLMVLYVWERRPWTHHWSPVQVFGRSSLFVYWIHVEMVYGLVSLPLHQAFSLAGAWVALGVFSVFILLCVIAKERLVNRWRGRPLTRQRAFAYMGSSAGGVKP